MYDGMPPVYKVQLDSLEAAIRLAVEYIRKEKYSSYLIDYLTLNASDEEERELLVSIKYDTKNHQNSLKNFYEYFTGESSFNLEQVDFVSPIDYQSGIKTAFLQNEKNIKLFTKLYTLILQSLCNETFTNGIFEILQDAQRHSSNYTFIIQNKTLC